jgi:hypothetical protein
VVGGPGVASGSECQQQQGRVAVCAAVDVPLVKGVAGAAAGTGRGSSGSSCDLAGM